MKLYFSWNKSNGTFKQIDGKDGANVTFESSDDGKTCSYLVHHQTLTPDLYFSTSGEAVDNIQEMTKVKDYYYNNYGEDGEMASLVADWVDRFCYFAHVVYLIEVE